MDTDSQEANKLKSRILEEEEKKKEEEPKKEEEKKPAEEEIDPKKKWKNPVVLKLDLNAVIPLGEFQTEIAEPGINLYENGALSKIDPAYENIYEQLKKASEDALKEGGKKGEGAEGEGEGGEEGGKGAEKFVGIAVTAFL